MSAPINTGGPAFPVEFDHQTFAPRNVEEAKRLMSGMTLRDYFAAKALVRITAADVDGVMSPEITAFACYRMADAMLKAREA